MPTPYPRTRSRSRESSGFTLVELVIVMALVSVAMFMFSSTAVSIARSKNIARENAVAAEAARSMLEVMRSARTTDIYALYNDDESDDPGGPGTAPGSSFLVENLQPDPDDPDGFVGRIFFPGVNVAPVGGAVDLELRENAVDPDFGLPRDLNGDSIISGDDQTGRYVVLPVRVEIRWRGKSGTRRHELFSTFCDFNWQ